MIKNNQSRVLVFLANEKIVIKTHDKIKYSGGGAKILKGDDRNAALRILRNPVQKALSILNHFG